MKKYSEPFQQFYLDDFIIILFYNNSTAFIRLIWVSRIFTLQKNLFFMLTLTVQSNHIKTRSKRRQSEVKYQFSIIINLNYLNQIKF